MDPRIKAALSQAARRDPRVAAVARAGAKRWRRARSAVRRRHAVYGRDYRVEPLPPGLAGEQLDHYARRMSWYHEIDLGGGVVTPAIKPRQTIAEEWKRFALGDLTGRSVLDIGGIDGAYSFLAERDGAAPVTVVDHYAWAINPDSYGQLHHRAVQAGVIPPAPHESEFWDPGGLPGRWRFDTARQALGSSVTAISADFMDCELARLGRWDVVLYLGVLYHMQDPVRALQRVAAVTREQAIIETEAMLIPGHPEPLCRFFPGGELNHDRSNWWAPNIGALLGMIGAAGFRDAEVLAGEPVGAAQHGEPQNYRAIVRALK